MLIDHADESIIHGAEVLAVEELPVFATPEQSLADRIKAFIDLILTSSIPKSLKGEIFQKLKEQHTFIKKGVIYYNGQSRPLPPFNGQGYLTGTSTACSFSWRSCRPQNEAEVRMCCKVLIMRENRPGGHLQRNVLPSMPIP